jgi:small subunit ribosomal protein S16
MAATIKLMRFGKKGSPFYRIVIVDKRKKRGGSYLEKIGYYNPLTEPATIQLDSTRLSYWQEKGAQLTDGTTKLLKKMKTA